MLTSIHIKSFVIENCHQEQHESYDCQYSCESKCFSFLVRPVGSKSSAMGPNFDNIKHLHIETYCSTEDWVTERRGTLTDSGPS